MNRERNNGRVGGMNMNGNNRMNGQNGNLNYQNGNYNGQNGYMNGTGRTNNGRDNMNGQLRGDLAEQIRALTFVLKELELYLDTHPNCRTAIDYYYRTVEELKKLKEEHENTVGPLTSAGVVSNDEWTWVQQPWPWQRTGDYNNTREDR